MPSLPVALAFQRPLPVILPLLPLALGIRAMPQNADQSSAVNPILLLHPSATEKTVNRVSGRNPVARLRIETGSILTVKALIMSWMIQLFPER